MDTKKKTFHCKTTTEQELTGKKILQNCRNQLYLDFPYLDGAFTSLEYKADSSIDTIGTDGELIYFNPVFLMKKYLEDPAAVRRGYLHMLLHCLYLHIFMEPDRDSGEWDRECDCFVDSGRELPDRHQEAGEQKKNGNISLLIPHRIRPVCKAGQGLRQTISRKNWMRSTAVNMITGNF